MYCGCAAPEEGIKNPPGVPGRCSKISVFAVTVPKLFQNGLWPIFISCKNVRKIPVFIVNTGYFYGCGGRTRTYDLRVMSPTSFQLLYSAIFRAHPQVPVYYSMVQSVCQALFSLPESASFDILKKRFRALGPEAPLLLFLLLSRLRGENPADAEDRRPDTQWTAPM